MSTCTPTWARPGTAREPLSADELLKWMDANEIAQAVVLPLVSPEVVQLSADDRFRAGRDPAASRSVDSVLQRRPAHQLSRRTARPGRHAARNTSTRAPRASASTSRACKIDDPRNMTIYAACGELEAADAVPSRRAAQHSTPRVAGPGKSAARRSPTRNSSATDPAGGPRSRATCTQADLARYPDGPVAPGGAIDALMDKYPNLYGDLSAGSGAGAISRHGRSAASF